jgi:RNA polymerase sigma factor (sigma-70 family)
MAFKAKKSKAVESSTPASWSVAQFSSFYTQNRSELIAHANRIVKDKAKAEEVTQEALVKFMLAAPELSSDDHALSYLHRTIENLCIDLFRAENRRPNLVALDDATAEVESTWQVSGDHSQAISSAEDAAIIRQALSLLSPAERAALVMWEVEGRSTAEIAKELGIKESAVRHTVSRARASLRKVLSELVIDEARGLTALDLLSTTYKKAAELAGKSSKIALTFILVLTAFLGLNSLTGNEPNTSITTSSSQLSNNQDMPAPVETKSTPVETKSTPVVKAVKPVTTNSISNEDLALHMQLAVDQLETTVLMLQVLNQADGGPAPTE